MAYIVIFGENSVRNTLSMALVAIMSALGFIGFVGVQPDAFCSARHMLIPIDKGGCMVVAVPVRP